MVCGPPFQSSDDHEVVHPNTLFNSGCSGHDTDDEFRSKDSCETRRATATFSLEKPSIPVGPTWVPKYSGTLQVGVSGASMKPYLLMVFGPFSHPNGLSPWSDPTTAPTGVWALTWPPYVLLPGPRFDGTVPRNVTSDPSSFPSASSPPPFSLAFLVPFATRSSGSPRTS